MSSIFEDDDINEEKEERSFAYKTDEKELETILEDKLKQKVQSLTGISVEDLNRNKSFYQVSIFHHFGNCEIVYIVDFEDGKSIKVRRDLDGDTSFTSNEQYNKPYSEQQKNETICKTIKEVFEDYFKLL